VWPIHWYPSQTELIWPVSLFNNVNFLTGLLVIYFTRTIFQALAPRVIIICHKTEPTRGTGQVVFVRSLLRGGWFMYSRLTENLTTPSPRHSYTHSNINVVLPRSSLN
jgi:hypothetical protein